jgi:hypothetical protein
VVLRSRCSSGTGCRDRVWNERRASGLPLICYWPGYVLVLFESMRASPSTSEREPHSETDNPTIMPPWRHAGTH